MGAGNALRPVSERSLPRPNADGWREASLKIFVNWVGCSAACGVECLALALPTFLAGHLAPSGHAAGMPRE